jgi:hypothetical protein
MKEFTLENESTICQDLVSAHHAREFPAVPREINARFARNTLYLAIDFSASRSRSQTRREKAMHDLQTSRLKIPR